METALIEHMGLAGILLILLAKEGFSWARNRPNHTTQSRLTALEVRMDKQEAREIPPAWFEREVRELRQSVDLISRSCIAHQVRTGTPEP